MPQVRHQCVTETETAIEFQLLTVLQRGPTNTPTSSALLRPRLQTSTLKMAATGNNIQLWRKSSLTTAILAPYKLQHWYVAILQVHGTDLATWRQFSWKYRDRWEKVFGRMDFKLIRKNCETRLLASSCLSVCLSVCPHGTTGIPTGRIFMKFDIWVFFENLSRKFKFHSRTWQE